MSIWVSALLFAVGVFLVVKGGDIFVDAASWIARAFGIPSFIIGATIVSVATTLPEMIVSIIAAVEGKVDMAIGNAVGSVTANTGLILGIAMLFMLIPTARKAFWKQISLLAAAAAVLTVACLGGSLHPIGSILLILIFAAFVFLNLKTAKEDMDSPEELKKERKDIIKNLLLFVLGAGCIVVGSQLLVNCGGDIALFFGVPERIIAVTLVAVGTSLPELVTTVTAIAKKESSLSIGNLIGANIIDLTLILPICSLVSGQALPVSQQSLAIDIPVCLGITLIAVVPLLVRQKSSKVQGIVLLLAYAAYLVCIL